MVIGKGNQVLMWGAAKYGIMMYNEDRQGLLKDTKQTTKDQEKTKLKATICNEVAKNNSIFTESFTNCKIVELFIKN